MFHRQSLEFAWLDFKKELEIVRQRIHSSKSTPWFRGHTESKYVLTPTILRRGGRVDPDDLSIIGRLDEEIREKIRNWKSCLETKKKLRKILTDNGSQEVLGKSVDSIRQEYHDAVSKSKTLKQEIADYKLKLERYSAPVLGERDLFDKYVYLAGKSHSDSSWQILTEMRHFGVPTRLLDWTDRFEIALYFATKKYRQVLNTYHGQDLDSHLELLPEPCIWVLNPYRLSKKYTGRHSILDLTRERRYDYYNRLLIKRLWPFDGPIPIYPPLSFHRIQAQSGYFTAHGNSKNPLDKQIGQSTKCLEKINISLEVAVYCVKYSTATANLNDYEVFQDQNSLGNLLANEFWRMQSWKKGWEL